MTIDLPFLWAAIIGFGIIMYVILDGFDLGIGILFLFVKDKTRRDTMMNSIAPVWDGNETWLVLGGAGLFAAFPKAYAMILPALYIPLLLFLAGLILRGISFEFRFKAEKHQYVWDWSFTGGSVLAAFTQGVILGNFVQGYPFPLFSAFSFMTGIALLTGYALLGTTWLIAKTQGELQEWCRKAALKLMIPVLFFIAAVSLWTPLTQPAIFERWFSWPNILYFLPVPLYTGLLAVALFVSLRKRWKYLPFLSCIGLFVLSYTGLAISLWPYIVPRVLTIWDAASPPESQLFILIGVLFLLPLTLAYTAHAYWVFRGKVTHGYTH